MRSLGYVSMAALCVACSGTQTDAVQGAAGSGGTSSDAASSSAVQTACSKTSGLPCGSEKCEGLLNGALEQAAQKGCEAALLTMIECGNSSAWECQDGAPMPGATCATQIQAYLDCTSGLDACSLFSPCTIDCPDWGVKCSPAGSDFACVCQKGANEGTSYTAPGPCTEAFRQDAMTRCK